jgi:hypothetical protein
VLRYFVEDSFQERLDLAMTFLCRSSDRESNVGGGVTKNFHSQITDYIEVSLTKSSMRWRFKQKVEESGSRKENETQARNQCQDG